MLRAEEGLFHLRAPNSKGIVWEHNSHVGDARATEMGARGEHNVGQLCRMKFGQLAYLVGFGTDRGTVAAASEWDGPTEIKQVRAAHRESYERLFHDSGVPAFGGHLRNPIRSAVRCDPMPSRLPRRAG